jgi:hypothetical protein
MAKELMERGPNVPTEERALRRLEQHVELGNLQDLEGAELPAKPRYLVTYMNSQTGGRVRSSTIVTVTNQSSRPNVITVSWFKGFVDNTSPSGSSTLVLPPDFTADFGSRDLPSELTVVNSLPSPELTFDEGRAIVSSRLPQIGVSARVYHTSGDSDEELLAITDSKVVPFGTQNLGD